MSEKPLRVQVAEAIGWSDCQEINGIWTGHDGTEMKQIPAYGDTFCATGPLIVHYNIVLGPEYAVVGGELVFDNKWGAKLALDRTDESIVYADSACEAIALAVVRAFSQGELKRL